jgi:vancomycin resistance protein VanW
MYDCKRVRKNAEGRVIVRLSELHPIFYRIRIQQKRLFRFIANLKVGRRFATHKEIATTYPYSCKKHQSLLRRTLGNSDPQLQENKITNLKIATKEIDGVIIQPGETFSFWKLVGKTTEAKGYIKGMQLSMGEVKTGVGGGICQLANLLYWMTLHTPLVVTERHHHSFDPFPDSGRTLPFGSGASVFYNYVDLRMYNPTSSAFQIKVWVTEKHLKGAIFSNEEMPYSYHIEERNHQFLKQKGKNYRQNEIWRKTVDKRTGQLLKEELLIENFSEVKYPIPDLILV